mmetsp:Transcript_7025/g.9682  ORF Transcript_7025/g.9682 Transcript_7025/m.9682 type:complete len:80 (-) Transcript_7025:78-317(-)
MITRHRAASNAEGSKKQQPHQQQRTKNQSNNTYSEALKENEREKVRKLLIWDVWDARRVGVAPLTANEEERGSSPALVG